jgi:peptide/nickel transport system permease protein
MANDAATQRATFAPAVRPARPAQPISSGALSAFERTKPARSRWWWVRTISPLVWVCLTSLMVFVVCGLFAGVIAPYDPAHNDLRARLQPPAFSGGGSTDHLLGTDPLGRDLLSRLIYGARVSLAIGFLGMLFGAAFGALCGLVSGFARGVVDEAVMFLVDAWVALPFLIIALSLVAILGSSLTVLIVLAALAGWASYTRVTRGLAMAARRQQYVVAARAAGAGPVRLLLRHILPNIAAPLIVLATLELTGIILLEASLSFLGFGVQPPTPAWGYMVSEGRQYLHTAWWVGVFPGVAIMLLTVAVSLTGDWLRDVLDPTLRS